MIGRYTAGQGLAHEHVQTHDEAFGCRMVWTFNVQLSDPDCLPAAATFRLRDQRYWLCKLNGQYYAWATRWDASEQPPRMLEFISRVPLPDSLRDGEIKVEVLYRWPQDRMAEWADGQYWFQTFPFLPAKAPSRTFTRSSIGCCSLIMSAPGAGVWGGVAVLIAGRLAGAPLSPAAGFSTGSGTGGGETGTIG